jgi:DNA-binding MarR family transcriptional regulator
MATRHYDVKNFEATRSIGYLLKLAISGLHDVQAAAFANHDVSFVQWLILLKLREGAAHTASDLCRLMNHDNGALTRQLDQLEERGYVERKRSESDRRVVRLVLTAAGRRKVSDLLPLTVDGLNSAVSSFSKAEFAELLRLLTKLADNLQANVDEQTAGGAS